MKIAIGSDKSGFNAKEAIKAYLLEAGVDFDDLGTLDADQPMPYYAVADKVAPLVQNGTYDRAILICGTGAGMGVVANKYKGVYAVACEGVYSARMAPTFSPWAAGSSAPKWPLTWSRHSSPPNGWKVWKTGDRPT